MMFADGPHPNPPPLRRGGDTKLPPPHAGAGWGGGFLAAALFLILFAIPPANAATPLATTPAPGPAESIGSAADGCLAGGVAMPLTGPGWAMQRPADDRYWGNPAMIAFLKDQAARNQSLGILQIGDIGLPRGGPMPTGHVSHQIGLDVDISFDLAQKPLTDSERDNPTFNSAVHPDGSIDARYWGHAQVSLLQSFAADPRVERIFVNPAIKRSLCKSEPDPAWLHKIRSWWGHDAHFHTRLNCPAGQPYCHTSAPVPEGDGCGAELAWWSTPEAAAPPPPAPGPKPSAPAACKPILGGAAG